MKNITNDRTIVRTAIGKAMIVLALIIAVFLIGRITVFADTEKGPALTVRVDGEVAKVYMISQTDETPAVERVPEIEAIPGVIETDLYYSGYNTYPTASVRHLDEAFRIDKIIEDATGKDVTGFDPDCTIKFTSGDGYVSKFTMGQLFGTERYYFPNLQNGTDRKGGAAEEAAYEDKVLVPVVILNDKPTAGANSKETMTFGQAAPNEQNFPECVHYMLTNAFIDISTTKAEQCSSVTLTSPQVGSIIETGTAIHFLPFPESEKSARTKDYYLTDPQNGQVPGYGDSFYYYAAFYWSSDKNKSADQRHVNPPVFTEPGVHTVVVKATSFGKTDSDVTELKYFVGSGTKAALKASSTYNTAKLIWNKQDGVSGYQIYRKVGSGAEIAYKTVGAGATSFTDTGLKTGTKYTYRITVLAKDTNDTTCEFTYSDKVSVTPKISTPSIKVTAGKRKAAVKWKKISGASGYVVYRSTKKTKGFKAVKTIKKGKTVSFTNKKLKKGKTYYFKVRAYRTVNGKRIYSSYSAVKKCKVK